MLDLRKTRIHPLFFLLIIIALFTGVTAELIISYFVLVIHECAHLFVARKLGVKLLYIEIMPFGISMVLDEKTIATPVDELMICAAGPICNLILALIFYFLNYDSYYIQYFIYSNLAIMLVNTVPIIPLDGGRVLKNFLVYRFGQNKAGKYSVFFSQINIVLIGALSIFLLLKTRFNVSLMLLCTFLIYNISIEKKTAEFNMLKYISSMKNKLDKRMYINARLIAVKENTSCSNLLKNFSADCMYFVNICDGSLHYKATISEQEIADAMIYHGSDIKIGDILAKKI